jgi:predicted permease
VLARIRSYWRGLFQRSKVEQDLAEELRVHLAERADALERSGLTRTQAERQACLEFGAFESYKERCREARGLRWPDELTQNLRYAARMARRSLGVTAVAVLSLALGIGANTGIFSILNSLLLTTLPVRDPSRLVILQMWRPQGRGNASYPLYLRLREGLRGNVLQDVCATGSPGAVTVSAPGADPMKAVQEDVSANYFDVLGVPLIAGHVFGANEEKIGSAPVTVLSERFWKNRLASDASIIGKTLLIDDRPATVIGIASGEFAGIEMGKAVDLWTNVTATDTNHLTGPGWNFLTVLGRLNPGVSFSRTQAALSTVFTAFQSEQRATLPEYKRKRQIAEQEHLSVESGATGISRLRERFALPLRIVMGVVALVLLIACANITNLMLARAAARQRELATRLALGAGSARLFRQFLTESLLLAACGGLLGLAVAAWTSRYLLDLIPQAGTPLVLDVHLSLRVLLFTSALAIGAGLLSGIVPAMRVGRSQLVAALKFTAASEFGGARGRIRPGKLLSVAQVALSTVLVFGAGLFVRTLLNLKNVDSGFRAEHRVTFDLELPRSYSPEQKQDGQRRLQDRLKGMPGVTDASVSWPGPFNGGRFSGGFQIPGMPVPEDPQHDVNYMLIGTNFFSVMGTPLLAGRAFDARDSAKGSITNRDIINPSQLTVAIINESLARTYFAGKDPVGMKIQPFPRSPTPVIAEIVGVAPNIRHYDLREQAGPAIYFPITEMDPPWAPTFEVRYSKDLKSASREIDRAVAQIDPRLRATDIQTMDQRINAYLEKERMLATIASLFGFIALLLAAVGLYGVMAYAVTRRTKEIGLRMALGARRRQVLDMILADGVVVAFAGVALGVPAALGLSRFLSSLLFDVKPSDAGSLAAPIAIMLGVAATAVLLPAWRAARVDPMVALRDE